ncbi:lytic polysaccharide monooxygenase [Dactylosporangium sp. CA-233914]|uniref:lytic polysaccharide monooxygenase n=1 Tax=Dactylosporangium sp. CA-233914 TaxID=3239934 RepID=UPI003D8ED3F4
MRRTVLYPLVALGAAAGSLVFADPASAHGYVSSPPSRQALCAQGKVADCGPIQYEPQSVEGPKGLRSCDGGKSQFAVLSDDGRNWPATPVGTSVTFNWVLTARHATSTWEYYIGDKRIAQFDDGGRQPAATVSHQVSLAGYSGRQKILAIWNIADTANAFYNCIDVQVGSGGSTPAPTPTRSPTKAPTTPAPTKSPSKSPTATTTTTGASTDWAADTQYNVGDVVTYQGKRYQCRQSHRSIYTWEPIYTLALWLPV